MSHVLLSDEDRDAECGLALLRWARDAMKTSPSASNAPRRRARRALLLAALVLAALAVRPAVAHVRAASLLLRFADERAQGGLAEVGRHPVDEEPATVETSRGPVRARVYTPRGVEGAPGVVLVHGVHRLGIDEPRLMRFSRAIAASGVVVLTPEVQEIADYTVDPRSVETIGAAARALKARLGGGRAGVMGMSFAGGLSLLAAADPRFDRDIGFVVSVGGHHDLARVSRFFATNEEPRPDGTEAHLTAHGYGLLVLLYSNAERFFPKEDVPAARDAIRFYLWGEHDKARAAAEDLSPESWAKLDALWGDRSDLVAPEILAEIDRAEAEMARVSPHGKLGHMTVPVFLLHGEGDTVIPAAETQWIAAEVPPDVLRQALVSPAIVHVELGGDTPFADKWALVHFMASVLAEADAARG
jgi:dienelactone hydrolase